MLITRFFNSAVFKILVYDQEHLSPIESFKTSFSNYELLNIFFTFSGVWFAKDAAQYL
jgi:hypothetical protein